MRDCLIRGLAAGGDIRIFVASTTGLVEEARRRHDTWPVATAALGRLLTGALLMGANLKGEDILTIRVKGDGPLGGMVATANAKGEVRGYVHEPHVDLPLNPQGKLDVGGAVGAGTLSVTKDMGLLEPYTGSIPLVNGEIAEDLTQYYFTSEQTPSAVALGVLVEADNSVRASGGFVVQAMPGAGEEGVARLEENLSHLPPVSRLVDEGRSPEAIMELVLAGLKPEILERRDVTYRCNCSRARLEEVLLSLGKGELEAMLREQGGAELTCHFCNEKYAFTAVDLKNLVGRF